MASQYSDDLDSKSELLLASISSFWHLQVSDPLDPLPLASYAVADRHSRRVKI